MKELLEKQCNEITESDLSAQNGSLTITGDSSFTELKDHDLTELTSLDELQNFGALRSLPSDLF